MTTTIAYADVAGLAGTDLGYTDWLEITQEQVNTLRRRHRRPPVDPRRPRAREGRTLRRTHRPRVPHPVARRDVLDRAARGRGRDHEGQLRPRQGALRLAGQGRRARAHERGRRRGHRDRGRLPARRSTRPSRSRAPPSPPSSPAGSTASTPDLALRDAAAAASGTATAPPRRRDHTMHNHGLGAWMAKRRLKTPDKPALDPRRRRDDHLSAARRRHRPRLGAAVASGRPQGRPRRVPRREQPRVPAGALRRRAARRRVRADQHAARAARDRARAHRLRSARADPRSRVRRPRGRGRRRRPAWPHVIVDRRGRRAAWPRLLAAAPGGHADADVTLDDPAAILYTSGTTGKAKGAVLTHENLTWVALNCLVDYDVVSTDVALMISPLFHAASLGMGALPVILKGATIVLEKGFEPGRALELIERHGVTMLSGVPTTYQLLADHPRLGDHRPQHAAEAHVRRIGRAHPHPQRLRGARAVVLAGVRDDRDLAGRDLARAGHDAREAGQRRARRTSSPTCASPTSTARWCPRGTVGEIEISGPNVFPGYHDLPEATAAAFTADGWFRSGDLGYLDADGYLYIADRLKDMIISGGENIYPAEIENLISDIDGVTGVAVIGVPDEHVGRGAVGRRSPCARAPTVDTEIVRARLDGRIARYKIPKNVVVVDELPRTASGKVRKADLRARFGRLTVGRRDDRVELRGGCRIQSSAPPPVDLERPVGRPVLVRGTPAAGADRPAAARASRRRASCAQRARCRPRHPSTGALHVSMNGEVLRADASRCPTPRARCRPSGSPGSSRRVEGQ